MDIIFECAKNFEKLIAVSYRFIVSKSRKMQSVLVDFSATDFYHLAGFQYLTDLAISKDRSRTISLILSNAITDNLLSSSSKFCSKKNAERDISSRIEELRYLEKYIETDNFINIFTLRNTPWLNSQIDAEYVIKSRLPGSLTDVFIFLRKRKESDYYCVVSFFVKKESDYGGDKLYWMLKEKITSDARIVLYQHPNFVGAKSGK